MRSSIIKHTDEVTKRKRRGEERERDEQRKTILDKHDQKWLDLINMGREFRRKEIITKEDFKETSKKYETQPIEEGNGNDKEIEILDYLSIKWNREEKRNKETNSSPKQAIRDMMGRQRQIYAWRIGQEILHMRDIKEKEEIVIKNYSQHSDFDQQILCAERYLSKIKQKGNRIETRGRTQSLDKQPLTQYEMPFDQSYFDKTFEETIKLIRKIKEEEHPNVKTISN